MPRASADRLRRASVHALDNLRSRFAVHIGHLQVNGPFQQAAKQNRRGNRWILPFSWLSKDLAERNMKMRVKMGTVVPKMGTVVHPEDVPADYRAAMAMALHAELGSTYRAIKSAMRWTGASERTVKYWFAGERGPSGEHLVSLARHSDAVLIALLALADRLIVEEVEDRER